MKAGKTLTELATEIERRRNAKADYVAPVGKLAVVSTGNSVALEVEGRGQFPVGGIAHGQLAEYAGIPRAYYDRMLAAAPALLGANVNRWLTDKPADKRMVRTLDGTARAFLSDKYRRLDNEDVAEAVLPVLLDMPLIILSCEVTERRLYIKAVHRDIERDVPTGRGHMGDGGHTIFDSVQPAITIGNSEVGFGSLFVDCGTFTRACTNLATFGGAFKKYHVGSRADVPEDMAALLTDTTKRLTDAALWAQLSDIVRGAFDVAQFEARCAKLGEAAGQVLPDPLAAVEVLGKRYGVTEGERKGILAQLIAGGSVTRYGLHAAVTRQSAEVEDYDRATELERLGGQLIELPASEWRQIAVAA